MKTINIQGNCCFVGDGHVGKSIYNQEVAKASFPDLPVNDVSLKRMFQHFQGVDIIFFSCGYPLHGCQEIETIKKLQNTVVYKRLIPDYLKVGNRKFYSEDFWKSLSSEDIDL
ncbi:hypothetical protein [Okeania sp. SIO2B3]|uniref:hypothetical protein n=1 Tax=Okeania sp. SIO2B3 TaxID=2607784 RepID=UPI0013BFE233|nr:hypothetical protein [Okeania sp. SIO2B3]NET41919.1 hypothetical protein [Okeania sp. SIO2B3]